MTYFPDSFLDVSGKIIEIGQDTTELQWSIDCHIFMDNSQSVVSYYFTK